jgi:hypothetical protein
MPRAIFKLLWDTLEQRQEIFAYVLNLAADGAHYWVLAHVTPSFGAGGRVVGYHSTRRRPEPAPVAAVSRLYQRIRAAERGQAGAREAVRAGGDLLREILAERGQTYDEFVWELTTSP